MALTPDERKMRLGLGGLARVARRVKRTKGHVTQVNSGSRVDAKVQNEITRRIVAKHPEIKANDVWPMSA